ncbi:aryl-alcohol dehydrogenase [Mycena metata]|uniref:Aryl-alcohol dehydrogenase n=1 Tax=Mycena metata TaxID=1033252 RepID=A0AAD7JBY1_9AGAR|nr:aryl-alcohol dehydrogenase [Mycena metata]
MSTVSKLARYRQLAPRAAVYVSPLALGTIILGSKWAALGMTPMDKESCFRIWTPTLMLEVWNHIDTANAYQAGESEEIIGEWAEARGNRDQLVIGTKYTFPWVAADDKVKQKELYLGNSAKSMKLSFEASLRKLRTSYVDIFYVHMWDLHSSVEEVMDGLHNLVLAGKVLYLGISDSPAWWVVKANDYARANGKTPFVSFQVQYSVLQRDIEREILPMCRHEVSFGAYLLGVLAAGHIRSDAEEERRKSTNENGRGTHSPWERTEEQKKMCSALEVVAEQVGAKHISAVAIAYTMHKAPYSFPVFSARKVEQLAANMEALDISLTDEEVAFIDAVLSFDRGFPHTFSGGVYGEYPVVLSRQSMFDHQPLQRSIGATAGIVRKDQS